MKTQSRFGITINNDCNCNCWVSIKQTDTEEATVYFEGCDSGYFQYDWYKDDGVGNFPSIIGTTNAPTISVEEGDLIAVMFLGENGCCSVMSNILRIQ